MLVDFFGLDFDVGGVGVAGDQVQASGRHGGSGTAAMSAGRFYAHLAAGSVGFDAGARSTVFAGRPGPGSFWHVSFWRVFFVGGPVWSAASEIILLVLRRPFGMCTVNSVARRR